MIATLLAIFVLGVMVFGVYALTVLGIEAVRVYRLLQSASGPEAFEVRDVEGPASRHPRRKRFLRR